MLLKGADTTTIGRDSADPNDFRQSYLPSRVSDPVSEAATTEDLLLSQLKRLDTFKMQVEKFRKDLGTLPLNPVISKSIENMELLDQDFQKLEAYLKDVKSKVSEAEREFQLKEQNLTYAVEVLKSESKNKMKMLEDMDTRNRELESLIKKLKSDSRNSIGGTADIELQNLRLELNDITEKANKFELNVRQLKQELEGKNAVLRDKSNTIDSLTEELEKLIEKADSATQSKIRSSIGQTRAHDSSDEEIDVQGKKLKKKQLIQENERLQTEVKSLKDGFENMELYTETLKREIEDMKRSLDEKGRDEEDNFQLGDDLFNLRNSEMLAVYQKAVNSKNENAIYKSEMESHPIDMHKSTLPVAQAVDQEEVQIPAAVPKKVKTEEFAASTRDSLTFADFHQEEPKVVEKIVEKIVQGPPSKETQEQLSTLKTEVQTLNQQVEILKTDNKGKLVELSLKDQKVKDLSNQMQQLLSQVEALKSEKDSVQITPAPQAVETDQTDASHQQNEEVRKKELIILRNQIEQLKLELAWYKKKDTVGGRPSSQSEQPQAVARQPHAGSSSTETSVTSVLRTSEPLDQVSRGSTEHLQESHSYPHQSMIAVVEGYSVKSAEQVMDAKSLPHQSMLMTNESFTHKPEVLQNSVGLPHQSMLMTEEGFTHKPEPVHPNVALAHQSMLFTEEQQSMIKSKPPSSIQESQYHFAKEPAISASNLISESQFYTNPGVRNPELMESSFSTVQVGGVSSSLLQSNIGIGPSSLQKREKSQNEIKMARITKENGMIQAKLKALKTKHDSSKESTEKLKLDLEKAEKVDPSLAQTIAAALKNAESEKANLENELKNYQALHKQLKAELVEVLNALEQEQMVKQSGVPAQSQLQATPAPVDAKPSQPPKTATDPPKPVSKPVEVEEKGKEPIKTEAPDIIDAKLKKKSMNDKLSKEY